MDKELKRSIILDNYNNPSNRGLVDDNSYIKINNNNTSCIDNINLMVKLEDGKIKDVKFDGEACVICISSTSVLTKLLIGKSIEEALNIINNYKNMIDEKEYNKEVLEEALAYDEIYLQPSRKTCATLSWNGIQEILEKTTE